MEEIEVGPRMHEKNFPEEIRELRKLWTAAMVEKCLRKKEVVVCPKPRRRQIRQCGEHTDLKVGSELSDIFISKASPPYYSVSPPVRTSNPLIQDSQFCDQRIQQVSNFGGRVEGFDTVAQTRRVQSIPTMA